MSVFTKVERNELVAFLDAYTVGDLQHFQGIRAGIENTNYFVNTSGGRWVLTLFETLHVSELPFCLYLMDHLDAHGIPSPAPVADRNGQILLVLKGKPAALVQRLPGRSALEPNINQCAAMGEMLARLHLAGQSYPRQRANSRGPQWWQRMAEVLLPHLDPAGQTLLTQELNHQARLRDLDLPRGVIHGDLFRDNVLFQGDRISGVIDFYYACNDVLLFDLAIAVNDWCAMEGGALDPERVAAAVGAYARERPFSAVEQEIWSTLLRAAALRFWLSRLHDLYFPRPGELTHTKDPEVFRRILARQIANPAHLSPARA
jgi:homoserine kinase type II